jgi:hypothetical protein
VGKIRIFIPTYRRPRLLERALRSLLEQTHREWSAEVHNDDPKDPQPAAVVASFSDSRLTCVTHPKNLGAPASFNYFYSAEHAAAFDYMALLEDDNAWEPNFLARLHSVMESHPEASLAWCNQSLDYEQADGSVVSLNRTVHPIEHDSVGSGIHLRHFGATRQAFGAIHANGAMLLRLDPSRSYSTPRELAFTAVESFRERLFSGPMIYLSEPLARFTVTQTTSRANEARSWAMAQTALVATFARAAGPDVDAALWAHARTNRPSLTNLLILAALADPACRRLLRAAQFKDVVRTVAGVLRRPLVNWAALRCRHAAWWPELAEATAARWREYPLSR